MSRLPREMASLLCSYCVLRNCFLGLALYVVSPWAERLVTSQSVFRDWGVGCSLQWILEFEEGSIFLEMHIHWKIFK